MLGIGGLRALKALELEPTVYHMNEGHSAFLALERIRLLMQRAGADLRGGAGGCRGPTMSSPRIPRCRRASICSTPGMMYDYFDEYCQEAGSSSISFCPWAAAIRTIATSGSRWRFWP